MEDSVPALMGNREAHMPVIILLCDNSLTSQNLIQASSLVL
jgi:hypothetical protein